MSLTVSTQTTVVPKTPIGPGLNVSYLAISQNATVTSFSVTSPFTSLFEAKAEAVGTTDPKNATAICTSTMGSSGMLSLGSAGAVTFAKNSTTQQDFVVKFFGT